MKKRSNKLALKTQTVRSLSTRSLEGVIGGWDPTALIVLPAMAPHGSQSGGVSCEGKCSN